MSALDAGSLARAALETVRAASVQARLIAADEVLEQLRERGFGEVLDRPTEGDPCLRVAAILSAQPDIASFVGLSGRAVYHDPAQLSHTYARILDRQGAPLALVAEEVRTNSRDYPRPVPLELFEAPPFALAPPDLQAALRAMAASPPYQDITCTTTSTGAVYLFSSRHLDRGYATFLAERAETLIMNP